MFLKMPRNVTIISVIILLIAIILSIYNTKITRLVNYITGVSDNLPKNVFTSSELSEYNGLNKPELFLAILGIVYNVTKGVEHYGVGKTYNIFVGRDASRSFITGKFDAEHASDDLTGLSKEEIYSLNHWIKFYKQEYQQIGKVIGRYYNENGQATAYKKEIKKLIKSVESEKQNQQLENHKFPPCNIEWNAELARTRVWCTKRSGGIERSWAGVPRQLYEPGSGSYRCACISDENRSLPNIREYEGCDSNYDSCDVKLM